MNDVQYLIFMKNTLEGNFGISIRHGVSAGSLIFERLPITLEVLNEDYVRTARGKGLREFWVIAKHALKNAMIPVIIVLALVTWVWHARPVRSAVLKIREMDYIEASRAIGASNTRIIVKQVFPNIVPVIIVICTTQIGYMILLESALSFFGLTGTTLSWGWDIAVGRDYIAVAWWMSTMPGMVLFVTVISLNMLGDWIRDITDPKMRGE
jgi:ABC-type dipeptide/oligopeptide/nickel transport system permease subunit